MVLQYMKPDFHPFENQKENAKKLIHRRRALLSDRVGAGKSATTLLSFAYLKEKGSLNNLLILTPLSAYEKEVWKKDLQKFTKLTSISVDELAKRCPDLSKLPNFLAKYDVIYGKHSHVKQHLGLLQLVLDSPGTLLCIDEIHNLKNPKSDLSIKSKALALHAKYFWGITGSSVSKNMEDLYNIVNLIYPWYLGSFTNFRDYYCDCREKIVGKTSSGKLRKVLEIVGVKTYREREFEEKLAPILIKGESFVQVKFNYIDYTLSDEEQSLYRKIAKGINLSPESSNEDWLSFVLSEKEAEEDPSIKDVERFSSRFIYLQSAADGVLSSDGKLNKTQSTKIDLALDLIRSVVEKGQSMIMYFDFLAPLNAVHSRILSEHIPCKVLLSTGEHVLDGNSVTEALVKKTPHIILGTRASAESASYYFINHVCFYNIPTTPHTFVQLVGRITRKNTLYPNDLNCHIFRSDNIDLYKLLVVSAKAAQLELVQGHEANIPDTFKVLMKKAEMRDRMKKTLLWLK